jgi:hypothetical protein
VVETAAVCRFEVRYGFRCSIAASKTRFLHSPLVKEMGRRACPIFAGTGGL